MQLEVKNMITGIEISEANGVFDWENTSAAFALIHHGSGTSGIDSQFTANVVGAINRGIPFGVIHTIKPEKNFKKTAEVIADLFGYPLPPITLVSTHGGLSKQKLMDYLLKMYNLVYSLTGNKYRPMIATNIGFWNASVARNDFAKKHTLMVYRWTNATDPGEPNDWSDINNPRQWTLWNYGKSSTGVSLVRFNGDATAFKRTFGIDPAAADDPQTPPPVDPKIATTKYRSNIRKSPYGDILTTVDPGLKFEIVKKENDHYAVVVYLHESVVDAT